MKIIKYFIGGNPCYLVDGQTYTQEELISLRDRLAGRRDRRYGIYNQWFEKNRKDLGKAYNQGCKDVEREPHIAESVVTVYV